MPSRSCASRASAVQRPRRSPLERSEGIGTRLAIIKLRKEHGTMTTTTNRSKTTKVKKETARDQGVPEVYLSEKGSFVPGMDARYKADLVNSALGLQDKDAKAHFEPADAEKRLEMRDWTKSLVRKREILAGRKMSALAQRLEQAASSVDLDSSDLARVLETNPRTVSRWLKNEVSPRHEARERLLEVVVVL